MQGVSTDNSSTYAMVVLGWLTSTLLITSGAAGSCTHPLFGEPGVDYAAGEFPMEVAVADLDGDQLLDLVVTSWYHDAVTLLRNEGSGTFAPPILMNIVPNVYSAAVCDLDGDDDLDLVVAEHGYGNGNVAMYLNDGTGAFAPGATYDAGQAPMAVTPGDFDGDSDLDLAVVNNNVGGQWPGTIDRGGFTILVNDGSGTFTVGAVEIESGIPWAPFAAGDLNGDLRDDLVYTDWSNRVTVRLSEGDGTFADPVRYYIAANAEDLVLADMDGDSDLDVAALTSYDTISVVLNDGTGVLAPSGDYDTGQSPQWLAAGDVDGDSDVDVVAGGSVLLNDGTGILAAPFVYAGNGPVALGDLDGDLDLDLAVGRPAIGVVTVLINECVPSPPSCPADTDGDGTVGVEDLLNILADWGCVATPGPCIGDANDDGFTDISDLLDVLTAWGPCPEA